MSNDELAAEIGENARKIAKLQKRQCMLLTIAANRLKDAGTISGEVHTLATTPKD